MNQTYNYHDDLKYDLNFNETENEIKNIIKNNIPTIKEKYLDNIETYISKITNENQTKIKEFIRTCCSDQNINIFKTHNITNHDQENIDLLSQCIKKMTENDYQWNDDTFTYQLNKEKNKNPEIIKKISKITNIIKNKNEFKGINELYEEIQNNNILIFFFEFMRNLFISLQEDFLQINNLLDNKLSFLYNDKDDSLTYFYKYLINNINAKLEFLNKNMYHEDLHGYELKKITIEPNEINKQFVKKIQEKTKIVIDEYQYKMNKKERNSSNIKTPDYQNFNIESSNTFLFKQHTKLQTKKKTPKKILHIENIIIENTMKPHKLLNIMKDNINFLEILEFYMAKNLIKYYKNLENIIPEEINKEINKNGTNDIIENNNKAIQLYLNILNINDYKSNDTELKKIYNDELFTNKFIDDNITKIITTYNEQELHKFFIKNDNVEETKGYFKENKNDNLIAACCKTFVNDMIKNVIKPSDPTNLDNFKKEDKTETQKTFSQKFYDEIIQIMSTNPIFPCISVIHDCIKLDNNETYKTIDTKYSNNNNFIFYFYNVLLMIKNIKNNFNNIKEKINEAINNKNINLLWNEQSIIDKNFKNLINSAILGIDFLHTKTNIKYIFKWLSYKTADNNIINLNQYNQKLKEKIFIKKLKKSMPVMKKQYKKKINLFKNNIYLPYDITFTKNNFLAIIDEYKKTINVFMENLKENKISSEITNKGLIKSLVTNFIEHNEKIDGLAKDSKESLKTKMISYLENTIFNDDLTFKEKYLNQYEFRKQLRILDFYNNKNHSHKAIYESLKDNKKILFYFTAALNTFNNINTDLLNIEQFYKDNIEKKNIFNNLIFNKDDENFSLLIANVNHNINFLKNNFCFHRFFKLKPKESETTATDSSEKTSTPNKNLNNNQQTIDQTINQTISQQQSIKIQEIYESQDKNKKNFELFKTIELNKDNFSELINNYKNNFNKIINDIKNNLKSIKNKNNNLLDQIYTELKNSNPKYQDAHNNNDVLKKYIKKIFTEDENLFNDFNNANENHEFMSIKDEVQSNFSNIYNSIKDNNDFISVFSKNQKIFEDMNDNLMEMENMFNKNKENTCILFDNTDSNFYIFNNLINKFNSQLQWIQKDFSINNIYNVQWLDSVKKIKNNTDDQKITMDDEIILTSTDNEEVLLNNENNNSLPWKWVLIMINGCGFLFFILKKLLYKKRKRKNNKYINKTTLILKKSIIKKKLKTNKVSSKNNNKTKLTNVQPKKQNKQSIVKKTLNINKVISTK